MSAPTGDVDLGPQSSGGLLFRSRHHLLLLALTTLLFLLIEYRHPYYFLQDDNRDQNLPYYVANIRAVANREFPLFNFHQFLGTPLLSCVQPAAFNPVNYLAGWASLLLFGHFFATIDLIAFCHLLIAALGFFQFMRSLGLSPLSGMFGALAWTYCGFVILVGNSWIQFVGFAAYQPWLGLLSLKLLRGFDARTFAALVVVRALQFFLGYPQIFVYSAALELLCVVLYLSLSRPEHLVAGGGAAGGQTGPALRRQPAAPFLAQYALHYVFVAVLTLPVLLPALHQIHVSADRSAPLSWEEYRITMYNLTDWVNGLVRPWAKSGVDMERNRHLHVISHVGYLVLGFAGAAFALKKAAATRRLVAIFALLGIAALLLASNGVLAQVLFSVPVFNRFRWLFKFAFFTSFYLVVVASFGLDLLLGWLAARFPRRATLVRGAAAGIIALQVCNVLYLHTVLPQRTFGTHLDPVPFDEPLKNGLKDGRVVSVGFEVTDRGDPRILHGSTARTLGFNYATLWELFQVGGYEILISKKNAEATLGMNFASILSVGADRSLNVADDLPLDYFRVWGVRWYLVSAAVPLADIGELQPVFADGERTVLFDPAARPFVYPAPGTAAAFRHHFTTNTVEIATVSATGGVAIINLLYHPFFKGSVDGVATQIAETADAQVQIPFPPGSHTIRIVYVDPYFYGGLGAAALLLCGAGIVTWRRRRIAVAAAPHPARAAPR